MAWRSKHHNECGLGAEDAASLLSHVSKKDKSLMTRKQRRAVLIGSGVVILSVAAVLVLFALRDTIVFFHTPSDVAEDKVKIGERFRLGGLVADGSVKRGDGATVTFAVTDTLSQVNVSYTGILPDLFREGQGVVTEGRLSSDGNFEADSVLAKHDENYMPANVAKALEERGVKLGKSASHPSASKSGDGGYKKDDSKVSQ